jgi:hypothetical protein
MLASKSGKLFNGNMETHDPHNARPGNRGPHGSPSSGPAAARSTYSTTEESAGGGRRASGLMDRMLAYRQWWNLPSRPRIAGASAPRR